MAETDGTSTMQASERPQSDRLSFPRVWIPRQVVSRQRHRWVRRKGRKLVRSLLVTTTDMAYLEEDDDLWGHIADVSER